LSSGCDGPGCAIVVPCVLKKSTRPSGLKHAPANSLASVGSAARTKSKICPWRVSPRRYCVPPPSSQITSPPRGLTQMLSGASSTSGLGLSKISVSRPAPPGSGVYCHTRPAVTAPPLVSLK
jgi:hypothetical protein